MASFKDYYEILDLPRTASDEDIKKAYRRLARQHHPDLHPEKDKEMHTRRMQEINEAYAVLASPENRAKYDQFGEHWKSGPPPRSDPRSSGGSGGRHAESAEGDAFSDFYQNIFRGAGRRGQPEDIFSSELEVEAVLDLSLDEAVHGVEKSFRLMTTGLCGACRGTGRIGRGICSTCGGLGEIKMPRDVKTKIPAGLLEGSRIRLKGQGNEGPRKRGDLFLTIHLTRDPRFTIEGIDLETKVRVMPWQAALGAEIPVQTLDGIIRVRVPKKTHTGTRLRLPGKGLGKPSDRGDLYLRLEIDIPETISAATEDLFKKLQEENP